MALTPVEMVDADEFYSDLLSQSVKKQELRSWFEANAQFPSTTFAAHMHYSAGQLSRSHHGLSYSTV